ncbi:MAG: dockerin type I domain-containing protein [Terriglobales bacterium]
MRKAVSAVVIALFILLLALAPPVAAQDKTWTLNADFDQGILVNLNHNIADQLRINAVASTFPFIGVAASGRGTMIRINTDTGAIVGEYWTSPSGYAKNPSRTTTDLFGNIWVTNRDESGWFCNPELDVVGSCRNRGSVTKIGLIIGGTRVLSDGAPNPLGQYLQPPFTYSTCRDRNSDGLIRTSHGLGNILGWPNVTDGAGGAKALVQDADDECILIYQRTTGYNDRHVSVDKNNNVWVGGYPYSVSNQYFDLLNGDTGAIMPGKTFHQNCGGYGGFTDRNGVIWSAGLSDGHLLRYDPATNTQTCINIGNSYGLAPDVNGYVWNGLWTSNAVAKFNPDGTFVAGFPKYGLGSGNRGVAVTPADNNVWVASSYANYVIRLDNNGNLIKTIGVGDHPTGVTVDSNGKVWVTNYNSSNVMRIDPNAGADGKGAVDLTVGLGGGAYPYNYSDMTGVINLANTAPRGAWVVTYDSGAAATPWGKLVWNTEAGAAVPAGASVLVEVRAADTTADLGNQEFIPVSNGVQFAQVGRFLEIRTTLYPNTTGQSPVFTNLALSKRTAAVCDVNNDGAVNRLDINLIFSTIGQTATGSTDPRDADGDGKITIYDARKCVLACSKTNCAI